MVEEVTVVVPVTVKAAGTRPVKTRPFTAAAATVAVVRRSVETAGERPVEGSRAGRHVVATGDDATAKLQVVV